VFDMSVVISKSTLPATKARPLRHDSQHHKVGLVVVLNVMCVAIGILWFKLNSPLIVIALCFIPLGALFVISQTFWLVSLFVIFSFFRIHEAFPLLYSLKLPLLLSMGALAALAWHGLISRQLVPFWHSSLNWLAVFWLLVTLGTLLASNTGIAIGYFKGIYWKIIVMTFAITWLVTDEISVKRLSTMIVVAGSLIAIVALANSATGVGLVEGTRVTIGRNIGSVLGDPNDLSLVLMFPLAFAIGYATTTNLGGYRVLGILAVFLSMAAVIATQSRGGLLGSVAVFAIFGLKLIRSKTLLLTLAAIGLIALFMVAGIADRQSGGAAEAGIDASAMGRIYAWQAAFGMALDNPFSGVGLNNFYANYYFYSPHWDGLNHAVHSTWFGILAETGFLGLAVFIGLIISLVRTSRNTVTNLEHEQGNHTTPFLYATALAVYAGLIGTIVSGTFLTQGFTWPIYILAALAISLSHIVQKRSQNEKT
jgi:probable O-glycosylation ligase (exosortase A-associated)